MKEYYFTFGSNHYNLEGEPMNNVWVRVTAPDYGSARDHFCAHFATPMMGNPSRWSFQYEAKDFKPEFFPQGEFEHLTVSSISEAEQITEL